MNVKPKTFTEQKVVNLTPEQKQWLLEQAADQSKEEGQRVTASEVMRRLIDNERKKQSK